MEKRHSFGLISAQQMEDAWPQIAVLLGKVEAFAIDDISAESIRSRVHAGHAHLFTLTTQAGIEAAMAMTFKTHKRGMDMNIAMFGGKHTRLIFEHYGDRVQQFAEDCGATRIVAWCRPSAARLFNSITGTKTTYHMISKDLT